MNVLERLETLAAAPKPWLVTTKYECGKTRAFRAPREAMARNHAITESRNIGRGLIDRATGSLVRKIDVTVEFAPE